MAQPEHTTLRLAGETAKQTFLLEPRAEARAALASELGISAIRKLRFEGNVAPQGSRDWALEGVLGATVVQPCVVTLEPVVTRIDTPVARRYLHDMPDLSDMAEAEMPEDDTLEALPEPLNLSDVMAEALALALPDFPRAEGVEPVEVRVTEPGKTAMTDEETKPFAGLAGLRDSLKNNDDEKG